MKSFKLVAIFCAAAIFFAACQKEIVFSTNGLSVGSLKENATGNCLPSTVNGIYQKDSAINSDNFIDVNVDVTSVGTYSIATDTVNGVSFKGTGTFGIKGNNLVRLYGHGKPTTSGISTFTVTYGATSCTIDVTVIGAGGGSAIYTLGGAGGNCSGFTLGAGTYNAGQILVAGNTATLNVSVLAVGTYNLTTDTVDGFWFNAKNVFTNATVQSLTLNGYGTPVSNGTYTFKLSNGNTSCKFTVTVGTPAGAATYTLGGSPGNCTGVTLAGNYQQGVSASGNTVKIDVNVLTLGTYNISVLANNFVSFSAAGTFTATGPQQITLNGSGTPATAATFPYVINGPSGTTCTFNITYAPATPPSTNGEYIPMTTGSNWSALIANSTPDDTTYTVVSPNSKTYLGNSYHIFESQIMGVPNDSSFFRKVGTSKYYEYAEDNFGVLDNPYILDFMVLDSSQAAGYTWNVPLGPNTAGGGAISISAAELDGTILEKGSTQTVAGITYTNVYRVQYDYKAKISPSPLFTAIAKEERWYAKGYGLIKDDIIEYIPSTTQVTINTTRTQIF